MSRVFGEVRQVGCIVRDVGRAMSFWTDTLGVGPFFVLERVFDDYFYRGRAMRGPKVTLAFANSGEIQIELIQQHDQTPSAYREFMSAGREGVQHLSSWFSDRAAYDEAHRRLRLRGLSLVHETRPAAPAPRFAYFETGESAAPLIEISEGLVPGPAAVFVRIRQAAIGWSGDNPIRDFTTGQPLSSR